MRRNVVVDGRRILNREAMDGRRVERPRRLRRSWRERDGMPGRRMAAQERRQRGSGATRASGVCQLARRAGGKALDTGHGVLAPGPQGIRRKPKTSNSRSNVKAVSIPSWSMRTFVVQSVYEIREEA